MFTYLLDQCSTAQELCESPGGRPGLHVPNKPDGFCGKPDGFCGKPDDLPDGFCGKPDGFCGKPVT